MPNVKLSISASNVVMAEAKSVMVTMNRQFGNCEESLNPLATYKSYEGDVREDFDISGRK